jgi:GNAT superfamily N-acetyltransferase
MAEQISWHVLTDPKRRWSREAVAIYLDSFPPEELDPVEHLQALMASAPAEPQPGETIFRFAVGVGEDTVRALSIYTYHPEERLAYLWYLATTAVSRGQGVGSWLLQQTIEHVLEDAQLCGGEPPVGICWEVERPLDAADPHEQEVRQKRIRFYERNGSLLLPHIDLLTPPMGPDLPEVAYYIMVHPLETPPDLSAERQRRLVDLILRQAYGVGPESSYYQRAMRSIG